MQRYFANKKENQIFLSDEDCHHLLNVLRYKVGEKIEVVCNKKLYLCALDSISPLSITVIKELDDQSEINKDITLYYCLSKGDKNDFVIQKATELGANKIVLVSSKRCVVKYDEKDVTKKVVRFQKIAKEAAEQCHRIIVPEIVGPFNVKNLNQIAYEENLFVAFEENKYDPTFCVDKKMNSIGILIGPEGGLEIEEVKLLNSFGFKNASLGRRILRTETAAVYALSIIAHEFEK